MHTIRLAITGFILILLAIVTMGWIWTGNNQPPAQSAASQTVLGIAALSGVFALVKIWRHDPRRTR